MEIISTFIFALSIGFGHAFEADHLAAISNLVTRRGSLKYAIQDGVYWGLGHTSTILLIGLLVLALRVQMQEVIFAYFEAGVGLALLLMGGQRLYKWGYLTPQKKKEHVHLAYGIGLIHGLAGSGALIILVMAKISGVVLSLVYLLLFGLGSVAGMLTAAGVFSLAFSGETGVKAWISRSFTLLSSIFCLVYGSWILYENLYY